MGDYYKLFIDLISKFFVIINTKFFWVTFYLQVMLKRELNKCKFKTYHTQHRKIIC